MNPTAVSQVIEALGKLILGTLLAKFTMDHGMNNFKEGKRFSAKWSRLRRRLSATPCMPLPRQWRALHRHGVCPRH